MLLLLLPLSINIVQHLLFIYVHKLHVHRVDCGKDIGRALHHALSRLRHGYGRACRQKNGLVPTAQR
jgi:hypothetical protein